MISYEAGFGAIGVDVGPNIGQSWRLDSQTIQVVKAGVVVPSHHKPFATTHPRLPVRDSSPLAVHLANDNAMRRLLRDGVGINDIQKKYLSLCYVSCFRSFVPFSADLVAIIFLLLFSMAAHMARCCVEQTRRRTDVFVPFAIIVVVIAVALCIKLFYKR